LSIIIINSDADRANALNAVLLFYLMQRGDNHPKQDGGDRYEKLLSEIMRKGD